MRELRSGDRSGYWWRIMLSTHGVAVGVHWPSRQWNQFQLTFLIVIVQWGRV